MRGNSVYYTVVISVNGHELLKHVISVSMAYDRAISFLTTHQRLRTELTEGGPERAAESPPGSFDRRSSSFDAPPSKGGKGRRSLSSR